MYRITRALAAVAVAAAVGTSFVACGGDDSVSDTAGGATSEDATATTPPSTSPTPLPGTDGEPIPVAAAVADRWSELGGPGSGLGLPTGPSTDVEGGSITEFEHGMIALTPEGRAFIVQGEILSAYRETGGPAGDLGFPTSDETTTDGGWISTFENGTIAFLDGEPVIELG